TFRPGEGAGPCQSCGPIPRHAHFVTAGASTPSCSYACAPGLVYPQCLGLLEAAFLDVGTVGGAAVLGGVVVVAAVMSGAAAAVAAGGGAGRGVPAVSDSDASLFEQARGLRARGGGTAYGATAEPTAPALSSRATSKQSRSGSCCACSPDVARDGNGSVGCLPRACCGVPGLEGAAPLTTLRSSDVSRLVQRIHLEGTNRPGNPWRLPLSPPRETAGIVDALQFHRVARTLNRQLRWGAEAWLMAVVTAASPGLAELFLGGGRFRRAKLLVDALSGPASADYFADEAATSPDPAEGGCIRVTVSADLTSASVDVLAPTNSLAGSAGGGSAGAGASQPEATNQRRNRDQLPFGKPHSPRHTGQPDAGRSDTDTLALADRGLRSPLVLVLGGEGTVTQPLFLDPSDPVVRAVPRLRGLRDFVDEEWPATVTALNAAFRLIRRNDVPGTAGMAAGAVRAATHPRYGVLGRAGIRLQMVWV
ncbi:unnamed protein product, partial [Symbiodinium sp. KB8]